MLSRALLVLAALALCRAHVRRDAPAAPDALQQLQKDAAEFAKTFSDQINALMNSKSSQQLQDVLKQSSDTILQQVSAYSGSLQTALKDADQKTQTAFADTRDKLKAIVEGMREASPGLENDAEKLRQSIASAVEATLQQSQKFAADVAANVKENNDKFAPKVKEAYDEFVKRAQDVQKSLHDAAEKH